MAVLYRPCDGRPVPADYACPKAEESAGTLLDAGAAAWRHAPAISWGPPEYATSFRALWTPEALAIRFDAVDPAPWSTLTQRDAPLWQEEVVELFLDPSGSGRDYAEVEISPANVVCDLRVIAPAPALCSDPAWHWDGAASRVVAVDAATAGFDGWVATASLPWDGLRGLSGAAAAAVPPGRGDRWRFNVFRVKRPGGRLNPECDAVYAAWSVPEGPSFHVPSAFRGFDFTA